MSKERALDVFQLLGRLDRKDHQVWETLTPEQQKEFSALVTMRWMAGTTDQLQLILLNEIINPTVFVLGDHRELLMKLLAVCSSGKPKRYQWINYKVGGSMKVKLSVQLIMDYYHLSLSEAEDTRKLFNSTEIVELAEDQGWQKDEIKNLMKELRE